MGERDRGNPFLGTVYWLTGGRVTAGFLKTIQ